jgi:methionyl-tRNA formyltransferase
MRILLVAEDAPGIQILRALRQRRHDVEGVVAREHPAAERGATMWAVAKQEGVRTWPAERVTDPAFGDVIRGSAVDLLLNAYSLFIVAGEVLKAPRFGAYNLHPGPLPSYAGLNSPSWAIFQGEREHGVTVHRMDPEIDSGPIAYQVTFPIEPTDTGLSLSTRCVRVGIDLMLKLVDVAARSPAAIPSHEQDLARRTYFDGKIPYAGRLSWRSPARRVLDFVRACDFHPLSSPWGTPIAVIAGKEFRVAEVSWTGIPVHGDPPGTPRWPEDGSLLVSCEDEWIRVDTVIDRGRRLSAPEAIAFDQGLAPG